MKYLIVHAHHEAKSFNGALTQHAVEGLTKAGHEVKVTDLYADEFDPVSDRRNFTTTANKDYLKQQDEERHASDNAGLSADIEAEIEKLEWADALVFQFPLWWFGMPGIMKGWVDRVFVAGRVYGGGQWYENGHFKGKLAMVSMTTGGWDSMYQYDSLNPDMKTILTPIHHGVFWFNGFEVVEPFITWAPARMTQEEREARLDAYVDRILHLEAQPRIKLIPTTAVGEDMRETDKRFQVAWSLKVPVADLDPEVIKHEREVIKDIKQQGVLLDAWINPQHTRGGMTFRVKDEEQLRRLLMTLPLHAQLDVNWDEIERQTVHYE